ncbi:VOC family protein [Desulfovibrio inopinatus]|uniref:VOC family protein n=1 Tax=Desulfovibrio inopinatus TaxID=102109 RepID=UPI0003FF5BCB|nr:VOC family protein [Desulfovibrio inopinatus]
MGPFTGVNHLAMVTPNMDTTIRFWRDLLGCPLVAGLGHPGYRHYFFSLSPHDMIAFFEWPDVEPIPERDHGAPITGPIAFDHVSLSVAQRDDLYDIKAKLEAAGFWASEVIDHGFILSLYAFDPHNIPIEFSYPVPGQDPRSCPGTADTNPSALAQEGANPIPHVWPKPEPFPEEDKLVFPGEGLELAACRGEDK